MKHDKTAGPRVGGNRERINGVPTLADDEDLRSWGWTLIDDDNLFEQAKREHAAEQVDASDETRLAAGWVLEIEKVFHGDVLSDNEAASACDGDEEPAPGPAGEWRLHSSGRLWTRWVLP